MTNNNFQAEQEFAPKTETPETLTDDSLSPSKTAYVDSLLEKACNEFKNFSGILTRSREMIYRALAYAYRYSKLASDEKLKQYASERGVKVKKLCNCHMRNKLVIELACQGAVIEYPNFQDRKKIYTMLLDKLCSEDLSFDDVVARLKADGIENIARGKTTSNAALDAGCEDIIFSEDDMVDDGTDPFNNDKKEEVRNDILDCLNRLDLDEATQENLKNKIINIFDDETVTVNKFTPEQKKVMNVLFDGRSKTGIKKTECYLHISQTETRYITRPDAVQKLTEKLSSFRESKNGKPYRSLFKNAED